MDGPATAAATVTGSTLSDDFAPARAGAADRVRSAADDAAFPVPPTTGRAYPRTGQAGAAWPAVADMPPNGGTSVIALGNAVLPAIEGRAGHPTPTSGQLPLQFPPLALSCGGQPRPRPVVVIRHVTSSARSCPQPARPCPQPAPYAPLVSHAPICRVQGQPSQRDPVSATPSARPSQPRLLSAGQSAQPTQRTRSADLHTVSLSRSALIRRPTVPQNRGQRPQRASEVRLRRRASRVAPTDALLR